MTDLAFDCYAHQVHPGDVLQADGYEIIITEINGELLTCVHPHISRIQELAYLKWRFAGSPFCDGVEFWLAAEKEITADKFLLSKRNLIRAHFKRVSHGDDVLCREVGEEVVRF
jgi:hypothetical protein